MILYLLCNNKDISLSVREFSFPEMKIGHRTIVYKSESQDKKKDKELNIRPSAENPRYARA